MGQKKKKIQIFMPPFKVIDCSNYFGSNRIVYRLHLKNAIVYCKTILFLYTKKMVDRFGNSGIVSRR